MYGFQDIIEIFIIMWQFVLRGGWALFVALVAFMLYELYILEIQEQFLEVQEWVFLNIRVPKVNELSTLAVEQIFIQMHALQTTITLAQQYVEGKFNLWYSLEIVSLGGKISFIIRVPKRHKELVESSFYAQYPQAEITEVDDYIGGVAYDPGKSDFDLFGFEYKLYDKDYTVPIKTYREFEHPTAEQKIVDPLKPLFEGLTAIAPHELYAVQILIRPVADDEWKPKGEKTAQELIVGEKPKHGSFHIIHFLLDILSNLAPTGEQKTEDGHTERAQERTFMQLSDVEKEKVNGVLRKIGKPGYQTKIRHLYIAPKNNFDASKKALLIGAYRVLGSANTNQLKPDTKRTWTSVDYKVSPILEQPYIDYLVRERKKMFLEGFKSRSMHVGLPPYILNVEELATIYHLPLMPEDTISSPSVEIVESRKSQPPANLPVGEP